MGYNMNGLSTKFPDMTDRDWLKLELSNKIKWLRDMVKIHSTIPQFKIELYLALKEQKRLDLP